MTDLNNSFHACRPTNYLLELEGDPGLRCMPLRSALMPFNRRMKVGGIVFSGEIALKRSIKPSACDRENDEDGHS
jgi:hypothetical protein